MKFIPWTCNILCYQKTNSFASSMQIQIQAITCCFLLLVIDFFLYTCIRLNRELHLPLTQVLEQARETDLYRPGISCVCAATRPTSLFTSDTLRLTARLNPADRILYINGNNEPSTVRSPSWLQDTQSSKTTAFALSLSLQPGDWTSLFWGSTDLMEVFTRTEA